MSIWDETRRDPIALRTYLDGLDERLAKDGVAIPARSFHAWSRVQEEMRICVSLGDPQMKPIEDYFAAKYGRRRLLDPSVGRMLVLIGHGAWSLRFPLVFGRVRVDVLRMIGHPLPFQGARAARTIGR